MFEDDLSYYRHRAEVELEHARAATRPEVMAVHFQLADGYRQRIETASLVERSVDA